MIGEQRTVGPQDDCVQCGETRDAIRASQRRQEPLYCAIVDYFGECEVDWERHRFIWTKRDQKAHEAHEAAWAKDLGDMAEALS